MNKQTQYNYNNINKYRYRFITKTEKNTKTSFFDTWCYGDIYKQITTYKNDLSKMCLVGVSNETHEIIEVIHLFNNTTIYKNEKY